MYIFLFFFVYMTMRIIQQKHDLAIWFNMFNFVLYVFYNNISMSNKVRIFIHIYPISSSGILMQWMVNDSSLSRVSHVILDEVHERDINCDFLLIMLKKLLTKRPDLKVRPP